MALRIRRLVPLLALLGLLAALTAGVGSVVALSSTTVRASVTPAPSTLGKPSGDRGGPCVAIIIDDVGRDLGTLERLLALELELSYAVLPRAPLTRESIAAIQRHGREILLHLPMAPVDATQITDEEVVVGSTESVESVTQDALARVPQAVGINNHMGSALSQDASAVARVLSLVRGRGLWFVDSRTTPRSQICTVARRLGVPCLERDLFLDAEGDTAAIRRSLTRALHLARGRGHAVAIGHPHPETVEALGQIRDVPLCRVSAVMAAATARDDT